MSRPISVNLKRDRIMQLYNDCCTCKTRELRNAESRITWRITPDGRKLCLGCAIEEEKRAALQGKILATTEIE